MVGLFVILIYHVLDPTETDRLISFISSLEEGTITILAKYSDNPLNPFFNLMAD